MRQIVCTLLAVCMFSVVSHAGQWNQDSVGWRYQNDDGTFKTGWHQDVSGKWYYLDSQTCYMLVNTTTPDGYSVGGDGVWIDVPDIPVDNADYENTVELMVTATSNPGGARQFGYSFPVTIHYNNTYNNVYYGEINVLGMEVSKDGVPYISFSVSERDIYELSVTCRYNLEDGSFVDDQDTVHTSSKESGEEISCALLKTPYQIMKGPKVKFAEIWIDKSEK